MIKRTDDISKLVVLAEDKNACEVGLMKKDGNKTVGQYIESILDSGVELSHFMWGRKNFQGDVVDDILFDYSKEIIDRIGTKKALRRFKNNNIVLTDLEIDYIKQIDGGIAEKPKAKKIVKDKPVETPKKEVVKDKPAETPKKEVSIDKKTEKPKKTILSWDERKKLRKKK